jgi:3-methyladenine DNA glycosylase/8-oxoguanine DNA glycosylase
MSELTRTWRPVGPFDLHVTMSVHQRGRYDLVQQVDADGAVWRTCRTPDGPATARIAAENGVVTAEDGVVTATAWGRGASWLLDALPGWLGAADRPDEFTPAHPLLERLARRRRGLRIGRCGLVMEALVPAVLEQKVTGQEAWRSWQRLLARYGEPAPGPAPAGMRVIPAPADLRLIPSWEWHRLGVGPERSRTIVRAARLASRLDGLAQLPSADAMARLQSVPGIGPWTAAEVVQRSHGDPDAVSVGDFNLPAMVAYALVGERTADDARMLELLEPYRGQRYRACLLLATSGVRPPRRAPRQPIRDYRRM